VRAGQLNGARSDTRSKTARRSRRRVPPKPYKRGFLSNPQRVLIVLASASEDFEDDPVVDISGSEIQRQLSSYTSHKAVWASIAELERRRFLTVLRNPSAPNTYRIHLDATIDEPPLGGLRVRDVLKFVDLQRKEHKRGSLRLVNS
jgi:hypothetical protein